MKSTLLIALALLIGVMLLVSSRRSFQPVEALSPEHGVVHFQLGRLQRLSGQPRRAVETLQRALANQQHASIHSELGACHLALGQYNEAVSHFEAGLKLDPAHAGSHRGLAGLFYAQDRPAEACHHYRLSLQNEPQDVSALNNLAWILSTSPDEAVRDGPEAVLHAERAATLTAGHEPTVLTTLAAAYAAAGRFEDAASVAGHALALAEASANPSLTTTLKSHLALYQAGQALR